MLPELFLKYAGIFNQNGYSLYMVGGSSRDYLLGKEFFDYDFVTDAIPEEVKKFIPNLDLTFAKFGSLRITGEKYEIDVTTLREEGEYKDSRHPSYIKFVKDLEIDSKRRDFTVNALYINKEGKIFDFHNGLEDLKTKTLRFIGDPLTRIKEDPLRILRAERFASMLNFEIEASNKEVISKNKDLLNLLNKEKVKLELEKCNKRK